MLRNTILQNFTEVIMRPSNTEKTGWIVTLTSSLFCFYSSIQMNMFAPLSAEISKSFEASASTLSLLSAVCFYSNMIFIIPAGLLLDRYSVKFIICTSFIVAVISSFMLAFAFDLKIAYISRILCGTAMSFSLTSCLKLASLLLPPYRIALASSLIVTIGMIGGIFSQTLVAFFNQLWGWRGTFTALGFFGMLIALLLIFIIRISPSTNLDTKVKEKENIWQSLKKCI